MNKTKKLTARQKKACEDIYAIGLELTALKEKKERQIKYAEISEIMSAYGIEMWQYEQFVNSRSLAQLIPPKPRTEEEMENDQRQQRKHPPATVSTRPYTGKFRDIEEMLIQIKRHGRTEAEKGNFGADFGPHGYPHPRPPTRRR